MKIDFANLSYQHELYKDEIEEAILKVVRDCNFIMGDEVEKLEKNLENFTGAKYAISCSSGTDALLLSMMALDIKAGDEVITTPFTFIATAETIAFLNATPVFVDIDEKTYNINANNIEEKITEKTKAIVAVSLYGQPCDMDVIQNIAKRHHLKVIVDGAQSFGSTYRGLKDSTFGTIAITSFFPAKPLGCYGDGGAVFTEDEALANKIKSLRVHGQLTRYNHQYIGMGARLDTIQAAVLNIKLKYYEKDLVLRQQVADTYTKALENKSNLILPFIEEKVTSAWAQYSIRVKNRDEIQSKLNAVGIPTAIHYPIPLHLQKCFTYLGHKKGDFPTVEQISDEILSLPMNPYIEDNIISFIAKNL